MMACHPDYQCCLFVFAAIVFRRWPRRCLFAVILTASSVPFCQFVFAFSPSSSSLGSSFAAAVVICASSLPFRLCGRHFAFRLCSHRFSPSAPLPFCRRRPHRCLFAVVLTAASLPFCLLVFALLPLSSSLGSSFAAAAVVCASSLPFRL
jgi:hypothetical protein